MVFDPWGRCRPVRLHTVRETPRPPQWETAFCSPVVSCRRGGRYTSILQETRYEQYLKKTYDRSELDSKTGPSGPCIFCALLCVQLFRLSFHLALHPCAPRARYPSNNARRTVQSVIIRRYTSKIADSFSSWLNPIKCHSSRRSHTRGQSIHFSRSCSKMRRKRNTDIKRLQRERERESGGDGGNEAERLAD